MRRHFRQLPRHVVEQAVQNHYDRFDGRPVRDFVPILVERAAQRALDTGHPTFG